MTDDIDTTTLSWRDFLRQQGAVWEGDDLSRFTIHVPARQPLLAPLEHQRLLRVAGPDTEKFLQGQLTCDMRRLAQGHVLLGAHCDAKGRMHSSQILAGMGDGAVGLRLHETIADGAAAALQKYIVFSKAQLAPADDWHVLALFGAGTEDAAAYLPLDEPEQGHYTVGRGLVALRHSQTHLEIWVAASRAADLWATLAPHVTPATPAQWDLMQIEQGIGQVRTQTAGEFIPQMLNFEPLNGISFDKGCYTGQEVVARMHYLGKSKKHMYRALVDSADVPLPGTSIYRAGDDSPAGLVVQAARSDENECALLVVCADKLQAEDPVALGSPSGPVLQWQPLPYSVV